MKVYKAILGDDRIYTGELLDKDAYHITVTIGDYTFKEYIVDEDHHWFNTFEEAKDWLVYEYTVRMNSANDDALFYNRLLKKTKSMEKV